MAVPRHGVAVVAVGGTLHVIGGGRKPGLFVSDAHEAFDLFSRGRHAPRVNRRGGEALKPRMLRRAVGGAGSRDPRNDSVSR